MTESTSAKRPDHNNVVSLLVELCFGGIVCGFGTFSNHKRLCMSDGIMGGSGTLSNHGCLCMSDGIMCGSSTVIKHKCLHMSAA